MQNPNATQRFLPKWSSLNRFGKSRLLRSSYVWLLVVPMLAKFLATIGPEIEIPLWESTITITIGLPFSWKMFYFSAVGFSLASLLYSTGCPYIIRDYERFSDFRDEGKGSTQLIGALLSLVLRPAPFRSRDSLERWLHYFIDRFCEVPPSTNSESSQHHSPFELLSKAEIASVVLQ